MYKVAEESRGLNKRKNKKDKNDDMMTLPDIRSEEEWEALCQPKERTVMSRLVTQSSAGRHGSAGGGRGVFRLGGALQRHDPLHQEDPTRGGLGGQMLDNCKIKFLYRLERRGSCSL